MEIFETPLFDDDFFKLLARFVFNCVFMSLIVFAVFFPRQKKKNYVFIYVMMNITVFFICFTMKKMDIGLGMALGLFAIFAILRYRTDAIRIKEMTYLFVVVGIAVVNSLSNKKTSYTELIFVNATIVATAYLLETLLIANGRKSRTDRKNQGRSNLESQTLIYDNLELMKPKNRKQLVADLTERTGIEVVKAEVKEYDLSNGTGQVTIYYRPSE